MIAQAAIFGVRRLSYSGSELSWVEDSSAAGHVEVAGVSGRWPGSDMGAGVAGFWDAWRTQQDLPQVTAASRLCAPTHD